MLAWYRRNAKTIANRIHCPDPSFGRPRNNSAHQEMAGDARAAPWEGKVPSLEEVRHTPRGVGTVAGLRLNSLTTSADVIKLQAEANAGAAKRLDRASWRTLTIRTALEDAWAALHGLTSDLYGNTRGPGASD